MDISLPPLAPRAVPDLRPSADVAASARAALPAPALPSAAAGVPPAYALQGALVALGLLDPRAVSPSGAIDAAGDTLPDRGPDRPPPRVLKPWGVPMLPAEERRAPQAEMRPGQPAGLDAPQAEPSGAALAGHGPLDAPAGDAPSLERPSAAPGSPASKPGPSIPERDLGAPPTAAAGDSPGDVPLRAASTD